MSSQTQIAILGRQPELGLVELEALLGQAAVAPVGRIAALIDGEVVFDRLGGVQKLATVLYDGVVRPLRSLPMDVLSLAGEGAKRVIFGISVYGGQETPANVLAAGLDLKRQLKARGSVRLVRAGKGVALSAAELLHNHVLEDGFELIIVRAAGRMIIARTTHVQDINWYSERDYDRPARSAKVGMLPPKLAQVLLNATSAEVVCDPFCGTGVVLQEARLMGRTAVGSDLSDEMVLASRTNMEWLNGKVNHTLPSWQVEQADARSVRLPAGAAIVSEGYLGPNLTHSPSPTQISAITQELRSLYVEALASWAKQLPSGAEVSICVPAWRVSGGWRYLGLVDELPRLGYTLKGFKHVRTPLLYARADQTVGRQLLLLRKN